MQFEYQEYQHKCVSNVLETLTNIFDFNNNDWANEAESVKEFKDHYKKQGYTNIPIDKNLKKLDILMETATGKTYTYLKAIFEINKTHKKNHFIIVLPRVAIKSGVKQTIKDTKQHFYDEYGKYVNIIDYPEDSISKVSNEFINSNDLTILILTNSSFNSEKNNINKFTETTLFTHANNIFEGLAEKHPILFIDEPHLLKGNKTVEYLEKLDALTLRFGATYPTDKAHRLSNVAYILDSVSAFNEYLVKKIIVHNIGGGFDLTVMETFNRKYAKVSYLTQDGYPEIQRLGLKEDIGAKTKLDNYKGVSIVKIIKNKIYLSNNVELDVSPKQNISTTDAYKMIEETIRIHFKKEERLFKQGIKTLSLFFIPAIALYQHENKEVRIYKEYFQKTYIKIRKEVYENSENEDYKAYLDKDFAEDGTLQVDNGYFAKKTGERGEKEAIDLILNGKKELLSLDQPLRFIFSVWALQEGWDNPNIMTICKLSNTHKETSRRQQVGRGLRLAVNQDGYRMTFDRMNSHEENFYKINTLDMIVSGLESNFIESIQNEIMDASYSMIQGTITLDALLKQELEDTYSQDLMYILRKNNIIVRETGEVKQPIIDFIHNNPDIFDDFPEEFLDKAIKIIHSAKRPSVEHAKKKIMKVKIKENYRKKFEDLWQAINRKATVVYKNIQEEDLVNHIVTEFNKLDICKSYINVVTKEYDSQENRIHIISEKTLGYQDYFKTNDYKEFVKDLLKDSNFLYPIQFILNIINRLDKEKIKNDPNKALHHLQRIIKDKVHMGVIDKIGYNIEETVITDTSLHENGEYLQEINSNLLGRFISDQPPQKHSLYDTVVYDSKIEEQAQTTDPQQVNGCEIEVFAKLPKISIPTPYKTYNPDFAYVITQENKQTLFLIVETKGYDSTTEIPIAEQKKIDYAKKFFQELNNQLDNVDIRFTKRLTHQTLSTILHNIKQL